MLRLGFNHQQRMVEQEDLQIPIITLVATPLLQLALVQELPIFVPQSQVLRVKSTNVNSQYGCSWEISRTTGSTFRNTNC